MARAARYSVIISLVILVTVTVWWWQSNHPSTDTTVDFYNIGQGDASHIRTPNGFDVVIDGGPNQTVVSEYSASVPAWDKTIELLVLTHPHADHVTGLVALFDYYQVTTLAVDPIDYNSAIYQALFQRAQQNHTQIIQLYSGDTITLDADNQLTTLYPFLDTNLNAIKDVNDTSIVLRLVHTSNKQSTSILFTGDAGAPVEQQLLQAGLIMPTDILKVGHHGSRTASTEPFLQAVQPHYAVIQSGAGNSYGHPHNETLQHLQAVQAIILRNDQIGSIHFILNNLGYKYIE